MYRISSKYGKVTWISTRSEIRNKMDIAKCWKVVWSKATTSKHSLILCLWLAMKDELQFRVELNKKNVCLIEWQKLVWSKAAFPNKKISWLAVKDRFPSQERLVKWGTMILMYVFCRSQMEFLILSSSSVLSFEFDICVWWI